MTSSAREQHSLEEEYEDIMRQLADVRPAPSTCQAEVVEAEVTPEEGPTLSRVCDKSLARSSSCVVVFL